MPSQNTAASVPHEIIWKHQMQIDPQAIDYFTCLLDCNVANSLLYSFGLKLSYEQIVVLQ